MTRYEQENVASRFAGRPSRPVLTVPQGLRDHTELDLVSESELSALLAQGLPAHAFVLYTQVSFSLGHDCLELL